MGDEWAVIQPDGTVSWLPPGSTREVKAITGGPAGGCGIMPVTDDGRLWLMAGRAAKFHPRDYPENLLAQAVVAALSGGRTRESFRGHIALAECDPGTASFDSEEIRPLTMSSQMAARVNAAIDQAAEGIAKQAASRLRDRILELQETAVAGRPSERAAAVSELRQIREQAARMEGGGVTGHDVLGILGAIPASPDQGRGDGITREPGITLEGLGIDYVAVDELPADYNPRTGNQRFRSLPVPRPQDSHGTGLVQASFPEANPLAGGTPGGLQAPARQAGSAQQARSNRPKLG